MRLYRRWVLASIIVIYLIILAGAVVRMTGSGMGCPDWPKCFGYLIPPTQRAELDFQPNREYNAGQVIIVDESLRVASKRFTSGAAYDATNWEAYDKHDYNVFNVYHTWTEYINRLIGALGGLVVLIMAVISFRYWRTDRRIVWLSWLAVFSMGVQAVIGKIVVDTLLSPVLITIHMVVALLIVGLLLYLYHRALPVAARWTPDAKLYRWTAIIIGATLVQVILGTQVRQHVDEIVDAVGYDRISESINEQANWVFYVHRSFSTLLLAATLYLFTLSRKRANKSPTSSLGLKDSADKTFHYGVLACIAGSIISGVLMNYVAFPFGSQAVHLVVASVLLGLLFYLLMQYRGSHVNHGNDS